MPTLELKSQVCAWLVTTKL